MNKKNIKFFILISIFIFVAAFIVLLIKSTGNVKKFTLIKSIVPDKVKRYIKENNIYTKYNDLSEYTSRLQKNFKNVNKKRVSNWRLITEEYSEKFEFTFNVKEVSKKIISNNNKEYYLSKFTIPFFNMDYYEWEQKPIGYIDQNEENIFFVTGNGVIFYFEKNNKVNDQTKLNLLQSNLKDIIVDQNLYNIDRISIKDILIHKEFIYLSLTREVKENCYNTSVIRSKINYSKLIFNDFFVYDECVEKSYQEWNAHQVGGALFGLNNKIYLSIGEFRDRKRAQDQNSIMGKNISIDLISNEYEIISMGHRNVQGMYLDKNKKIMLMTEHGPRGGDELNINRNLNNQKINNYGWPISSYGEHYNNNIERPESPLYKSHEKYGFIEPIKYWKISVGIGTIEKIPENFSNSFGKNSFLIGSMGWILEQGHRSIYNFSFNDDFSKITETDIIPVDERIRDILIDQKHKKIYLVLENSPAIGILELN